MKTTLWTLALLTAIASPPLIAAQKQDPGAPPAPGRGGAAPAWKRVIKLDDGRSFVTDGGLSIDVAVVSVTPLPTDVRVGGVPAKSMQSYLTAKLPNEVGLSDLRAGRGGYTATGGVLLNTGYIDYLRRALPAGRVRLRMNGPTVPVVVVLDGKAVGVVMPMQPLTQ
jgi:hypothetical protein